MPPVKLAVQRVKGSEDLPLPSYASAGAAGLDLHAAVSQPITLQPGERAAIPTGVRIALPWGFEGQIRGRSGNALKRGLGLPNAPGTIDCDYRGEIVVILINWSGEPQTIHRGERIAQLIVAPVTRVEVQEATDLDETARGEGGFGHTGL